MNVFGKRPVRFPDEAVDSRNGHERLNDFWLDDWLLEGNSRGYELLGDDGLIESLLLRGLSEVLGLGWTPTRSHHDGVGTRFVGEDRTFSHDRSGLMENGFGAEYGLRSDDGFPMDDRFPNDRFPYDSLSDDGLAPDDGLPDEVLRLDHLVVLHGLRYHLLSWHVVLLGHHWLLLSSIELSTTHHLSVSHHLPTAHHLLVEHGLVRALVHRFSLENGFGNDGRTRSVDGLVKTSLLQHIKL